MEEVEGDDGDRSGGGGFMRKSGIGATELGGRKVGKLSENSTTAEEEGGGKLKISDNMVPGVGVGA